MERHKSIFLTNLCGLAVCALIILLNAFLRQRYGLDATRLWVNLILPFGSICLGFAASLGFIVGARYSNYPAQQSLLLVMAFTALSAFAAMPIINYYIDVFDGIPARSLMSLQDYLQNFMTKSSVKLSHMSAAESYDLGRAGFILPLGDFAGFVGGFLGGFFTLRGIPQCKKCRTYFETIAKKKIMFFDSDTFGEFLTGLPDPSLARLQSLKNFESGFSPAISTKGILTFVFEHRRCPNCQDQFVNERTSVYDGREERTIPAFSTEYPLLQTSRTIEPDTQYLLPQTRQFGRKRT